MNHNQFAVKSIGENLNGGHFEHAIISCGLKWKDECLSLGKKLASSFRQAENQRCAPIVSKHFTRFTRPPPPSAALVRPTTHNAHPSCGNSTFDWTPQDDRTSWLTSSTDLGARLHRRMCESVCGKRVFFVPFKSILNIFQQSIVCLCIGRRFV